MTHGILGGPNIKHPINSNSSELLLGSVETQPGPKLLIHQNIETVEFEAGLVGSYLQSRQRWEDKGDMMGYAWGWNWAYSCCYPNINICEVIGE